MPSRSNRPLAAADAPLHMPCAATDSLTLLFAVAVGIVVLNLFASQALIASIGPSLGLGAAGSVLVTTLTLLGYAAGLFFLVPLGDVVENRPLIVGTLALDVLALATVGAATGLPLFLAACFVSGVTTSAIQMLVPVAAALTPEAQRGRVVGNVMSGLMLGILLSRPLASLAAEAAGWRWFYAGLAAAVAALALALWRRMPPHRPTARIGYVRLMASMAGLLKHEPVVRRRALSQALCMAAFSMFWTAVALRLVQAPFTLGNTGLAMFALAGAGGAIVAPIAGRAGDRHRTRPALLAAHLGAIAALALAWAAGSQRFASPGLSLAALAAAALVLDMGVIADQTLGRRAINLLRPEARGRLNGLYTGLFFLGGAAGAGLSGMAWTWGGWPAVCAGGIACIAAALILSWREQRAHR